MLKREPLMPVEYFLNRLSYIDQMILSRLKKLREQPETYTKPQTFLRANLRDRHEQLFLAYSVGETKEQLASRFPAVIDAYEAHIRCPGYVVHDFADLDRYVISLWLVSFALLFKVNDSLWTRLLVCIGNEGRDSLFEALVATRSTNRKQARGLAHATIFAPLLNAIEAKGESRGAFMNRYLKDWYSALKSAYWVGNHRRPDGGFFGYWAVEVAGVVEAFGMDDSAFRDMPYYPHDLVS